MFDSWCHRFTFPTGGWFRAIRTVEHLHSSASSTSQLGHERTHQFAWHSATRTSSCTTGVNLLIYSLSGWWHCFFTQYSWTLIYSVWTKIKTYFACYLKRNFISLNGLWHFPISYMYSETRMVLKIHKHKARITPTIVYLHFVIAF